MEAERVYIARAWESDNFRPQMFGGLGMSAQRAAWQAAFQAELAARKEDSYAQSLLDLVKAFEKVQHFRVKAAAKKHGYDLTILRLTFSAYRMGRVVGVDGVMSRIIVAMCGITAGSGTATTELRVLLLDIVDQTYALWATVSLTVFVDDMSVEASGHRSEVRTDVAGATDYIVKELTHLDLEVSVKKSVVLADRLSLAKAVARTSKTGKVSAVRQSKLLGAPAGGGRRRATRALAIRLAAFAKKKGKIHALRKVGVNTLQLTRAMGTPAVMYGVFTCGMATTQLARTRSTIASAVAPEGRGKKPELILWACDCHTGTVDPAFDAHGQPIAFWAYAWWQQWRPANKLVEAAHAAMAVFVPGHPNTWKKAVGPVLSMLATCHRIGWEMVSPWELKTDVGRLLNLQLDPPAVVETETKAVVRRWRWGNICKDQPCLKPPVPDMTVGAGPDGIEVVLDFARSLAKSRGPDMDPRSSKPGDQPTRPAWCRLSPTANGPRPDWRPLGSGQMMIGASCAPAIRGPCSTGIRARQSCHMVVGKCPPAECRSLLHSSAMPGRGC